MSLLYSGTPPENVEDGMNPRLLFDPEKMPGCDIGES